MMKANGYRESTEPLVLMLNLPLINKTAVNKLHIGLMAEILISSLSVQTQTN